jgi:DNA-binding PadR family transcriptional regulator
MKGAQLKGHLDLLLLSVLADGPQHGYVTIAALRDRSDGAFDLPEGTVYPALHRLEDEGLVRSRWALVDSRRRRIYELTATGRKALVARRREWKQFSGAVTAVIGATA